MKERYQEIEDKTAELRDYLETHPKGLEFTQRYEASWIYHDAALEGTVYTQQELQAALFPEQVKRAEASIMPVVFEILNHKSVCDFIREEAKSSGKKNPQLTLTTIKRMHDLFLGNTPEAQQRRAMFERRERTEKELARERERAGYRKDMPLHRTYFHDIAQPAKIPGMLEKLVDFTAGAEFREYHPIKQASYVQHQLIQIFPFADHSGKVGRMCSNLILLRHGYLPAIIHSIDRQKYYDAFRGPVGNFRSLLMEAMENGLDNGIKYFRDLGRRYRAIN